MKRPLRVLHVEDSEDDAALIERELRRNGYEPTVERVDTPAAMKAALEQGAWDAVIADYAMPHFSGPAALEMLKEVGLDLPFIIVSGAIGEETAVEIMRAGGHDYIMKGNLKRLVPAIERELREAEVRRQRRRAEEELRNAAMETLLAVSTVVEAKDPYTSGHSQRVTEYALKVARRMGLPEAELQTLCIAGLLHDVGKVGIPDAVLNKPSRLTRSEWQMMYSHPVESASVAEKVAAFRDAVPAIRHHHELWNGTGYPDGLKGEEIPLLARLLTVADWYEAMTSDRPYRSALSKEEALAELSNNAGLKLDPRVVEAFLGLVAEAAL